MMVNTKGAGFILLVIAAALGTVPAPAAAAATATWPTRPVRIIVGFPPATGNDMIARLVGTQLADRLGQPVVIENRPGANSIIAAELTARAAPDGHTVMIISTSHAMNAALYGKLPFDPVKSFTPVTMLASASLVLAANNAFPANGVKGLIDLAMAKPDTISYAVSGTGGVSHFASELFARMAGIKLVNIPYKGGPPALSDLMTGRVQLMFGTHALLAAHIRAGRMKALGVSSLKRTPLMPDVPTIAESGVPGYEMNIWWGLVAPAGLPAAVTGRLNREITQVLAQPESQKRLEAEGAAPAPTTSAEFGRVLAGDVAKWTRVAREAGIKAE